jgi:cobaltochelatase CobN
MECKDFPKIMYITNVDRRYFMMNRALENLKGQGRIGVSCGTLKAADTDVWNGAWEKKLSGLV